MPRIVNVSASQEALLRAVPWHLEEFPGDGDRLRVVLADGTAGPWFSRRWETLDFKRFWPS